MKHKIKNQTASAPTLFRGNTLASKSLYSFAKNVGKRYLHKTLIQPIEALLEKPVSLEVNKTNMNKQTNKQTKTSI